MIIYKITNLINGKVYIGQTIRKLSERWSSHCHHKNNTAIHNAITKYGKENFSICVIDNANTRDELDQKEMFWINFYNSLSPNGYNFTKGGIHYEITEETRKKHAQYCGKKHHMWGKHLSEEAKRKLSVAFSGKNNPFYGKHLSEETKEKLRQANLGRKITDEQRKLCCIRNAGENNPFFGKHHSEETKQKIREIRQRSAGIKNPCNKAVKCIETGKIYPSIRIAANETGIGETMISRAVNGVIPHAKRTHWAFV